ARNGLRPSTTRRRGRWAHMARRFVRLVAIVTHSPALYNISYLINVQKCISLCTSILAKHGKYGVYGEAEQIA
ncbi:MAG: hypothetical protein JSV99_10285, partial [Planctomycetota bacterium]